MELVRVKGPSKRRSDTEELEVVCGDRTDPDPFGLMVSLPICGERELAAGKHVREDACQLAIIPIVGIRQTVRHFRVAVAGRQNDQLLRIPDRQGPKKKGIDDAVDRGVEADSKSQGDDHYASKAGAFTQRPQTVPNVLPYRAHLEDSLASTRSSRRQSVRTP